MFVLESPTGTSVLFDPYEDVGYRVPNPEELDVAFVTVSHEHGDHNNVELGGAAIVQRGVIEGEFNPINGRITEGGTISTVESWHDEGEGSDRGPNAIFIVETRGLRVVHLGDLGHTLSQEQIDAIGAVDVLLVPVGGHFTIDAAAATEVVGQLQPRVTVPMHYRNEWVSVPELAPVDDFLEGNTAEQKGSSVELDAGALPEFGSGVVWVLEPAGARQ
jgi:L-ascorbate metabolism protein UlaG (beta-lactamase superfamily)